MARLPVIQASQPLPAVGGRARMDEGTIAADTAAAAESARRAADRLLGFAEKQKAVQDTIELSKASSQAMRELDDYRVELDKDGDYATKAARFEQKSKEVREKHAARFGGETQARFLASFENTSISMENSVRHAARRDEVEQGRVEIRTANEDLVGKAAVARTPAERDAILAQVDGNLQEAVRTGIMTAAQHKSERRAVLSKFDEAQAQALIRTNPGGAIAALGSEQFKYLDPVRRELLKSQAQQRIETLGATARAEARVDATDLIAGFRSDIPPADAEARIAAIKRVDPKLADRVAAEARTASTLSAFRSKPLLEQQQTMRGLDDKARNGGLTGEERSSYLRMQQVYAQEIQRWASDPFAASLQTSQAVREAYDRAAETVESPGTQATAREAALEWQTRNGVPPGQLAVVSKAHARQLADELATLDGAAFNQRWAQLKDQYGSHFAHLQRQLSSEGAGLGKVASIGTAAELPDTPKGQTARANLIDAGKISEQDLKKLYPDDRELTKVRTAIEEELAPFRQSLAGGRGGMQTTVRYTDDALRLAALFQQQGKSSTEAARMAVQQLVGDHYAFVGDRGGQVRVPRTVDGGMVSVDTVAGNMEIARDRLTAAELAAPPDPTPGADPARSAEAFARRVKAYARWVTEQGGRGAVLAYEANGRLQPVLRKDGTPVRLDFMAPALVVPAQPGGRTPAGVPTLEGQVISP